MHQALDRANDMAGTLLDLARMMGDVHGVVALRVLGLAGIWPMPDEERQLMIQEKIPALTEAMLAGLFSALSGHGPERILRSAIAPISEKVSKNHSRLIRAESR